MMLSFKQWLVESADQGTEYEVIDHKLPSLQDKIKKLQAHADKLGQPRPTLEHVKDEHGNPVSYLKKFSVEVPPDRESGHPGGTVETHRLVHKMVFKGSAPIVKDSEGNVWKHIGNREHVPNPNGGKGIVMNNAIAGHEYNKEITSRENLTCDHCKNKHGRDNFGLSRVKTHVFQDSKGKQIEVGRNHASEFFGHNIDTHLNYAESIHEFSENFKHDEDSFGHSRVSEHAPLHTAITKAVASIKKHGFVPTSEGPASTRDAVSDHFFRRPTREYDPRIEHEPKHEEIAHEVINHFKDHPDADKNGFIGNARTLARTSTKEHPEGFVHSKGLGVVAAMANSYLKSKAEKESGSKQFDQTPFPADKIDKKGKLSVEGHVVKKTSFSGMYGVTHFITAHVPSESGGHRIITMKSSSEGAHNVDEGDKVRIEGKIESHGKTSKYHGDNHVTTMAPRTSIFKQHEFHSVGDVLKNDDNSTATIKKVEPKKGLYHISMHHEGQEPYDTTATHDLLDQHGFKKHMAEGIMAAMYDVAQKKKEGKIDKPFADYMTKLVKIAYDKQTKAKFNAGIKADGSVKA